METELGRSLGVCDNCGEEKTVEKKTVSLYSITIVKCARIYGNIGLVLCSLGAHTYWLKTPPWYLHMPFVYIVCLPHPGLVSLLFMPSLYSLFLICTSKFKILQIKNREYSDGIKSKETRPEWGEAHNACVGTTEGV